jgi:hypothetical protein
MLVGAACVCGAHASARAQAASVRAGVVRVDSAWQSRGGMWPAFSPDAVPMAIYVNDSTHLFGHPAPPSEFAVVAPGHAVMAGRHPAVIANSSASIGNTPTATLLWSPRWTISDAVAIAVHEAFHVWQRRMHPTWAGNEAEVFTYPTGDADALAQLRAESRALRIAVAARDTIAAICAAREALAVRGQRYAQLGPSLAAYERGTELNEGLASWVERGAATWPRRF